MKKLLFILACTVQFVNAQNTIIGEYISTTKNSNGVKLFFLEDNTYQISVFSGKYKIKNDSIILENDSQENSFNVLFEKGKKASNKLTIKAKPYNYYSLFSSEYLGIQKTENSEIEYKLFKDYFNENELEEYTESVYKAVENADENSENKTENPETKLSFEIDRAYALYFVRYKETKSKIEKYIIPNDVNIIDLTINDNYFSDIELSGKVENDKSIIFLTDGKSPISFIKKSAVKKIDYVLPSTKTSEKKWTFPGMKSREDYYDYDSTAVAVDTAMTYSSSDYKFNAKVEKDLKEAIVNLKKEPAKYLFVYYNLKGKKTEKEFNNFIEEYNRTVGYNMYSEYDASYDKFNLYLATKSDEAFFKKNNINDKSILILNKEGKIIASSTKTLNDIASKLSYDNESLINKLQETENAIALANSVSNKKTSIPELTKSLNTNYKDFFTSNYYYNNRYAEVVETENNENDVMVVEDTNLIAVDTAAAVAYENNDFKYYKSEVSEKILVEKLNTIFEYYNSKNMVNNDLVNILLGEISENHINFDLFKNNNNINNKQEIKYINYILKYNEDQKNKTKIAMVLNGLFSQKEANNPDIKTYNTIATGLISYSGNNIHIIQNEINNFNAIEKGSEDANKLVDLYYNTLVNDKPIFENLDTQFNNLSTDVDYTMDWAGYKNRINSMLNAQAWDIFELNKTEDFERAIKWSELSNIVDKNNAYSLDTLGQLYFAVGRKSEAIVIQTKAVALAKEMKISHEEFEEALNNMKK